MINQIKRSTHKLDATGKIVGRLASEVAHLLMGKNLRTYAPQADCGDKVVVRNVKNLKTSGRKMIQKEYKHYSGYPGGLKSTLWSDMFERDPGKFFRLAVYRMLPKNKLRTNMIKRLTIEE